MCSYVFLVGGRVIVAKVHFKVNGGTVLHRICTLFDRSWEAVDQRPRTELSSISESRAMSGFLSLMSPRQPVTEYDDLSKELGCVRFRHDMDGKTAQLVGFCLVLILCI